MSIAKGDTVYLENGTEVEYITGVEGKHIVYVHMMYEDGEPIFTDPKLVNQVFTEPPIEKRHARIAELDEQIAKRRDLVLDLEKTQFALEQESKRFAGIFERNEALSMVDAFLERRIKFVVSDNSHGVITLETFDKAMEVEGKYEKGMKLLSLFGGSNGKLQWRLNKYSTEGDPVDVWPFFDLPSALTFVQQRLNNTAAEMTLNWHGYASDQLLKSFDLINRKFEVNLTLPEVYIAQRAKLHRESLERTRSRLDAELKDIEVKLANLKEE